MGRKGSEVRISKSTIGFNSATRGGFATVTVLGSSLEVPLTNIFNNTAETGELISSCNSDISVSDQLVTATDPIYSACTLISGNVNDTQVEVITTDITEAQVDTTTTVTAGIPTTTNRPTTETTMSRPSNSLPTEPNITSSV